LAIILPEQPVSPEKLIRLPSFPAGTIPAGLAIALAWSLAGIVSVILPAQLMQYGLPNWSGPMLFIFVISGVLLQPLARRLNAQRSLQLGCALLVLGYIIFTVELGLVSSVSSWQAWRSQVQLATGLPIWVEWRKLSSSVLTIG
jgi:hypothetical protein